MSAASTSTSSAPPVRGRKGGGICTRMALVSCLVLLDFECLFLESLGGVAKDAGGGGGTFTPLHAHHHVDHAVGKALSGDAAVGLGGSRGMIGVAVIVAEDLLPAFTPLPLDADHGLRGNLVADLRG